MARRDDNRPSYLRSPAMAEDLAAELTELAQTVAGDSPRDNARRARLYRWATETAEHGYAPVDGPRSIETTEANQDGADGVDGVEYRAG